MSESATLYSIRRRIEFANCDPAGIVFYVEFYRMCNAVFEDWFVEHLGLPFADEFFVHDRMFPVVHNEATFTKTLRMGDILDIDFVLTKLGRSSIHYTCVGRTEGEESFRVKFVNSIAVRSAGHSIPIPEHIRTRMQAYLEVCRALDSASARA